MNYQVLRDLAEAEYYEFKLAGAELPVGQRVSLEQSVNSHRLSGRPAIAIVAERRVFDCGADIPAAGCVVRAFYLDAMRGWVHPREVETALSLTKKFLEWVDAGCHAGA